MTVYAVLHIYNCWNGLAQEVLTLVFVVGDDTGHGMLCVVTFVGVAAKSLMFLCKFAFCHCSYSQQQSH